MAENWIEDLVEGYHERIAREEKAAVVGRWNRLRESAQSVLGLAVEPDDNGFAERDGIVFTMHSDTLMALVNGLWYPIGRPFDMGKVLAGHGAKGYRRPSDAYSEESAEPQAVPVAPASPALPLHLIGEYAKIRFFDHSETAIYKIAGVDVSGMTCTNINQARLYFPWSSITLILLAGQAQGDARYILDEVPRAEG